MILQLLWRQNNWVNAKWLLSRVIKTNAISLVEIVPSNELVLSSEKKKVY